MPAIYNSNLDRYDWHAPEPTNESCNATVHVKFEQQIDQLQAQIQQLRGQVGVHDLDPIVLEDLQMSVMDDDDEIDFIPTMPNPIVKEEPSDNFDFGETDEMSDCGNEIYDATSNDINMTTAQNTSENNIENESVDEQNTQNPMQIQSIYNNVAGYVHFTVDVIVLIFCFSSDTFHWALCFYIHL